MLGGLAADAPRQPPNAKKGKNATAVNPTRDRAAMFKAKDTNHDGKLTLEEYLYRFPDEAEGRRRFPTFDTNKDGFLSLEEYSTDPKKSAESQARFKRFDKNNDGKVSREEFVGPAGRHGRGTVGQHDHRAGRGSAR